MRPPFSASFDFRGGLASDIRYELLITQKALIHSPVYILSVYSRPGVDKPKIALYCSGSMLRKHAKNMIRVDKLVVGLLHRISMVAAPGIVIGSLGNCGPDRVEMNVFD